VFAQVAPHRIDVHQHVSRDLARCGQEHQERQSADGELVGAEDARRHDKGGVATAITVADDAAGHRLDKAVAARVARESNEFAKKLESDHKGRFGTFAMLPFPHVDECLEEIAYAFDTLKVDGIGCMTSYRRQVAGLCRVRAVWEELNRRKAIVYTHPTAANCCVNLVRGIDDAYPRVRHRHDPAPSSA
jgi:hypothetical protein